MRTEIPRLPRPNMLTKDTRVKAIMTQVHILMKRIHRKEVTAARRIHLSKQKEGILTNTVAFSLTLY